ncbi:MAG: ABC transporter permease [Gemmatimonadota bacterium]
MTFRRALGYWPTLVADRYSGVLFGAYVALFAALCIAVFTAVTDVAMLVFDPNIPGVKDASSLKRISAIHGREAFPVSSLSFSRVEVDAMRHAAVDVLTGVEAYGSLSVIVSVGTAGPEEEELAVVSEGFLSLLGSTSLAGPMRWRNERRAIIVSEHFVRRTFPSPQSALGAIVRVNGIPWTVQAVVRDFRGINAQPADLFIPLESADAIGIPAVWLTGNAKWLRTVARYPGGGDAQRTINVLQSRLASNEVDFDIKSLRFRPLNMSLGIERDLKASLLLMSVLTSICLALLLISNTTQLFALQRLASSHKWLLHEVHGATPAQVVMASSVAGLVAVAMGSLVGLGLERLFLGRIAIDTFGLWDGGRAITTNYFTAVVILAALLSAILPALHFGSRVQLRQVLEAARLGSVTLSRTSYGLLATQVSLVTVLVLTTAFSSLRLRAASRIEWGYDIAHVYSVAPVSNLVSPRGSLLADISRELKRRPGVDGVSEVSALPARSFSMAVLYIAAATAESAPAEVHQVDSAFFRVMQLPVHWTGDGGFAQWRAGADVALLSESARRRFFPRALARGCVRVGVPDGSCISIIGTVDDADLSGSGLKNPIMLYEPLSTGRRASNGIVFRALGPTAEVLRDVQELVRTVAGPEQVQSVRSVRRDFEERLRPLRTGVRFFLLCAMVSLVACLTSIASASLSVISNRRREIAISLAVGGSHVQVALHEMRKIAIAVGVGIAAGLPFALVLMRLGGVFRNTPSPPLGLSIVLCVVSVAMSATVGVSAPLAQFLTIEPSEVLRT